MGGVKANVGHSEPAAGLTGLIKGALLLTLHVCAGNAHERQLSPALAVAVREDPRDCWLVTAQLLALRRTKSFTCGVSSFGFSGTIAHVLQTSWSQQRPVGRVAVSLLMLRRRSGGEYS